MKVVRDNPIKSSLLLALLITMSLSVIVVRRNFYGRYNASVIEMALAFTARHLCSCYFVQARSEPICREDTKIEQLTPTLEINVQKREVTSTFLFWQARARDMGPDMGCVL
jgi:hypothetical protein